MPPAYHIGNWNASNKSTERQRPARLAIQTKKNSTRNLSTPPLQINQVNVSMPWIDDANPGIRLISRLSFKGVLYNRIKKTITTQEATCRVFFKLITPTVWTDWESSMIGGTYQHKCRALPLRVRRANWNLCYRNFTSRRQYSNMFARLISSFKLGWIYLLFEDW